MRKPFTIITTVHNGDAHLVDYFDNLASILGPNDHAVIVDDGSENPVALPDRLQDKTTITVLHPGRIGRGAALNLALENSPIDLIAIQDIDDASHPDRFDHQAKHLTDHPGGLVFATATSDPWRARFGHLQHIPAARLYFANPLHHSSLAMHRSVWERIGGYDTDLPCCIDLDFYLRAVTVGQARIWRIGTPLITRTLDPQSRYFSRISADIYQQTLAMVLDRHRMHLPRSIWPLLGKLRRLSRGTL
ncbi:glycosyltransferase family 2 protein [Thalassospira australica]|uniref:glycosyltransferase family 2 protein n=1 Tax=Thalassospira australica TaxID=1528106 RepID=UPI00051A0D39|nr:glycosyltransferase family A protein [Thalassospira australica]